MSNDTAKLRELILNLTDTEGNTLDEVYGTIERIEARINELEEALSCNCVDRTICPRCLAVIK